MRPKGQRGDPEPDLDLARLAIARHPATQRQVPAHYPLGRHGEAVDVAEAIAWLLSYAAGWVSGQVIPVDGSLRAVRPMATA